MRFVGILEGISFLVLLGIAMPLKYIADMPIAVKIVGMTHGMLFLLYCIALIDTKLAVSWNIKRMAILFAAAFVPFGPFLMDKSLRREDDANR